VVKKKQKQNAEDMSGELMEVSLQADKCQARARANANGVTRFPSHLLQTIPQLFKLVAGMYQVLGSFLGSFHAVPWPSEVHSRTALLYLFHAPLTFQSPPPPHTHMHSSRLLHQCLPF
jgi:hypothetical protein